METSGLTNQEAEALLKKFGENKIEKKKKVSPIKIFLSQFTSPLILLLIFAAIISFLVNFYQKEEFVDSFLILLIVFLSGILGFYQEYKAERIIESLQKLAAPKAKVIREGKEQEIEASKIVPGDIIVVEAGDIVPADAEILEGNLQIDESILTGESRAVKKKEKEKIFSGTSIFSGRAIAKVFATGMKTEIGKIAEKLQEIEEKKTPFEKKMEKFTKKVVILTLAIIALTFVLSFKKFGILEAGLLAISLAVAAVPEALPAVTTIALALGTREMAKRNALVRKLKVIESVGSVDVICTDKTGTLTEGKMKVKDFWFLEESEKAKEISLKVCYYCNNSKEILKEGKLTWVGDETEIALKQYSMQFIKEEGRRVEEFPFSSERMMMSVIYEFPNETLLLTKGAPEVVLKKCNRILKKEKIEELDEETKKKILEENSKLAEKGIRVLALAYKPIKNLKEAKEEDLIFLSLVSLLDLPRKDVKEALEECYQAGIRVIMITGDNPKTAKAIAEMIGLKSEGVVTGEEIEKMSKEELKEVLERGINIFARASPFHKLKILEVLKEEELSLSVVMTGDGVNDALAIKKADVGIAMGIKGSEVAKEASDIVLLDDNFASIRNAVKEGRRVFDNIRKFVLYLFSCNIAEVFTILFFSIFSPFLVLFPIHLLWINLVTDGLPAIALSNDPASENIMKGKTKKEILGKKELAFILVASAILTFLLIFEYFFFEFETREKLTTIIFTSFVIFEMARIFGVKLFDGTYKLRYWRKNKFLLISVLATIILQILLIYSPLASFFSCESLNVFELSSVFLLSLILVGLTSLFSVLILKFVK
jgi:Ca2+-transporting ATPase